MAANHWRRLNAPRDHRWAQGRLSDYIDGEMTARRERRLQAHEDICPECAELIRGLQAILVAMPALQLGAEDGLAIAEGTAEKVMARVGEWG